MAEIALRAERFTRCLVYNAAMTVSKFRRGEPSIGLVLALILASCAMEDFGAGPNWSATFCSVRPPTDRPR